MNPIEYFASGNPKAKRCVCDNISFIIRMYTRDEKKIIPTRSRKRPTLAEPMFPPMKLVKQKVWEARCSQCGKVYYTSTSKGWLEEQFKKLGVPFTHDLNTGNFIVE
jgi:hypothetical protein